MFLKRTSSTTFQLTRSRGAWLSSVNAMTTISSFQLTRSRGAWQVQKNGTKSLAIFQLTRSRGAWQDTCCAPCGLCWFQLTRSRGAWLSACRTLTQARKFQLTRSRGAWQISEMARGSSRNFNSHAHVERDRNRACTCGNRHISTHTLTWSVTLSHAVPHVPHKISTHTLTWSVTGQKNSRQKPDWFQLTRSRGAWQKSFKNIYNCSNFNSHAHVERDGEKVSWLSPQ